MSEDSFPCHTWGGGATGILGVEARDPAEHPTRHSEEPSVPAGQQGGGGETLHGARPAFLEGILS